MSLNLLAELKEKTEGRYPRVWVKGFPKYELR